MTSWKLGWDPLLIVVSFFRRYKHEPIYSPSRIHFRFLISISPCCKIIQRIRWPGNLQIQRRSSDGCLKKSVVMLKLFLTASLQMFQKWVYFINYHSSSLLIWRGLWDDFTLTEQAVVLCQVEKAKEDMLNQLYSSIRLVLSLLAVLSDDHWVCCFLMDIM